MRILAASLAAAGAFASPPQQLSDQPRDATREGFAFVELAAERAQVWLEEPLQLVLRFGVAEDFLETRAVQPFRQRLDVPVQVLAPWLGGLPGASARPVPEPAATGLGRSAETFALNDGVRTALRLGDREVDGRAFRVYEVGVALLPTSPGELRIPAPRLALAWATRFEPSLLDDRAPVDRVDGFVVGDPLAVEVLALPEEGRPLEFTGAVGRMTMRARADRSAVRVGESLKLEVTIEGEGNVASFPAPDWGEIPGFRVLGSFDERTPEGRVVTLDLAPADASVREVPVLRLAYFDPGPPAGYRFAETEPIAIVVAGTAVGGSRPVPDAARRGGERGGVAWAWMAVLGVVGVAVLVVVVGRRG